MHELGLLRSVVTHVERIAAQAGASRVEAVGLRVGTLSGALPAALEGAWPMASAGTVAHGSRLEVEVVRAAVWCPGCQAEQPVDEVFALTCPVCGTPTGQLVRGREFAATFADLVTADDAASTQHSPGGPADGHPGHR
jgi:hydrogenase nickel incorporation protein HypA/HybF